MGRRQVIDVENVRQWQQEAEERERLMLLGQSASYLRERLESLADDLYLFSQGDVYRLTGWRILENLLNEPPQQTILSLKEWVGCAQLVRIELLKLYQPLEVEFEMIEQQRRQLEREEVAETLRQMKQDAQDEQFHQSVDCLIRGMEKCSSSSAHRSQCSVQLYRKHALRRNRRGGDYDRRRVWRREFRQVLD